MSKESYNEKPHLNTCLADMKGEVWKEIKGYEGIYSISNLGRVRSEERLVAVRGGGLRHKKQSILSQQAKYRNGNGRKMQVQLRADGVHTTFSVAVLVGNAFLGPCKEGHGYTKKNGLFYDLRAENLEITDLRAEKSPLEIKMESIEKHLRDRVDYLRSVVEGSELLAHLDTHVMKYATQERLKEAEMLLAFFLK